MAITSYYQPTANFQYCRWIENNIFAQYPLGWASKKFNQRKEMFPASFRAWFCHFLILTGVSLGLRRSCPTGGWCLFGHGGGRTWVATISIVGRNVCPVCRFDRARGTCGVIHHLGRIILTGVSRKPVWFDAATSPFERVVCWMCVSVCWSDITLTIGNI